jgi:repressor LexA
MKKLTEKQKGIVKFIEDFADKEGMAPTVYEIGDEFDVKTSTVFAHLRALQKKKVIYRSSKARSIKILEPFCRGSKADEFISVPLIGRSNAGLPVESNQYKEGEVLCAASAVGGAPAESLFALRIHGESMRDLGIYDGDVVIVSHTMNISPGDIVVALVDNETTVKSFFPTDSKKIELRPANSDFQPQVYPAHDVTVQGKVVALQREY